MTQLILGYAEHGPSDGMGPFKEIFDKGERLYYANNLDGLDAIVLWGGEDISPSLYGEQPFSKWNSGPERPSSRDLFEWELMNRATKQGIPIIGVCRGAQIMCAYAGGKLVQNVSEHRNGHHAVKTYDGEQYLSTTCHHQMMYPYDIEHDLLAWMEEPRSRVYQPEDTKQAERFKNKEILEPEVVYFPTINGIAVQGHPEWQEGTPFNEWFLNEVLQNCFNKVC